MESIEEQEEITNPLYGKFDEMVDALLVMPPDSESEDGVTVDSRKPTPHTEGIEDC